MNKLLSGKTAIVTGASSGIGHATAATLARAGAAVVIHARRKERLDSSLQKLPPRATKPLPSQATQGLTRISTCCWSGQSFP